MSSISKRRGKLLLPAWYAGKAPVSELRTLFSVFYPYKIQSAGIIKDKIMMYGVSPLFDEITDDPKRYGYPTYQPVFQSGEFGSEFVRFEKIAFKAKKHWSIRE